MKATVLIRDSSTTPLAKVGVLVLLMDDLAKLRVPHEPCKLECFPAQRHLRLRGQRGPGVVDVSEYGHPYLQNPIASMESASSNWSAPPDWYSVTRLSKKFFSFLIEAISSSHGKASGA